jgi:hypothetical protein
VLLGAGDRRGRTIGPPTFRFDERIPLSRQQHESVSLWAHHLRVRTALAEPGRSRHQTKGPLGDLLLAEAYWWQAINNLDRPELVTRFREHASAGIAAGEKLLARDEGDAFGLFTLGGLYGRKAILDGLTGKRLESVNTAVKARKYLRLLTAPPQMDSAYFGLGVSTAAAELRWFALAPGSTGARRRQGTRPRRDGTRSQNRLFTQVDARSSSPSPIWTRKAGTTRRSSLKARTYRGTWTSTACSASIGRRRTGSTIAIEEMVQKSKTEPVLGRQSRDMTTYFLANTYKVACLFDRATPLLDSIVADPDPKTQWLTSTALIERGRIYDAKGKRMAAIADYQRVLALKDFRGSHDKAKSHLATAYVVPEEERSLRYGGRRRLGERRLARRRGAGGGRPEPRFGTPLSGTVREQDGPW